MANKLEEAGISWVIIGAQTRPTVMPKIEWVQEIVEAADKAGIAVFLKDNLMDIVPYSPPENLGWLDDGEVVSLRQEIPVGA